MDHVICSNLYRPCRHAIIWLSLVCYSGIYLRCSLHVVVSVAYPVFMEPIYDNKLGILLDD